MTAALRSPARRFMLAIALSVLLHAAILWLPYMQLPHARVQLPPLSVRLEPLPEPVVAIPRKPQAEKEPSAIHLAKPADRASPKPDSNTIPVMVREAETASAQPLPRQLQLSFTVYRGADGFRIGEILQQLDIRGDRYMLKSVRRTSGLASLGSRGQLVQTSRGKIGEHGLQPEFFDDESINEDAKQTGQVTFDRAAARLRYSNGVESALPADTQDILSFMYQLSQLPMNVEVFALPVSDGEQLRQYQFEIGVKENIATPFGNMRALHLRKMHTRGEAYFEIWLGLEYRMLPVKFRQVDGSGEVIEEFDISDIRTADK